MLEQRSGLTPQARQDRRDRLVAGVHEAGHAVVAIAVGWQVESAHITADLAGGVSHTAPLELADTQRRLMVVVAGPVAEKLWTGEEGRRIETDPAFGKDRVRVLQTLEAAGVRIAGAVDDVPAVRQAVAQARVVLRENWPAVLVIGDELRERAALTGREIHAIATAAGLKRWQPVAADPGLRYRVRARAVEVESQL